MCFNILYIYIYTYIYIHIHTYTYIYIYIYISRLGEMESSGSDEGAAEDANQAPPPKQSKQTDGTDIVYTYNTTAMTITQTATHQNQSGIIVPARCAHRVVQLKMKTPYAGNQHPFDLRCAETKGKRDLCRGENISFSMPGLLNIHYICLYIYIYIYMPCYRCYH